MEVTGETIFELKNWMITTNWAQNGKKKMTHKKYLREKIDSFYLLNTGFNFFYWS